MCTLLTKRCFDRLHLPSAAIKHEISGLNTSNTKIYAVTQFSLRSSAEDSLVVPVTALVVPSITSDLPSQCVDPALLKRFSHLSLADPSFCHRAPVDLLIGSDMFHSVVRPGPNSLIPGLPCILDTIFGSVLFGTIPDSHSHPNVAVTSLVCSPIKYRPITLLTVADTLDKQVCRFWELESIPSKTFLSQEEEYVESHFKRTTTRSIDGRYTVSLPFNPGMSPPHSNRAKAYKSFLAIESKINKDPIVQKKYQDFMNEYQSMSHMIETNHRSAYVIPHHAVFKSNDPSGKIRVVFNASAADTNGHSLNDCLLAGPKLQSDIRVVLNTFRSYRFVICCDAAKMFRMIKMAPEDQHFQHVLWRPHPTDSVKEFALTTVVYGLKSSPYHAQRVLHQLVEDDGQNFLLASHALLNHRYVDDIITGAQDVPTAKQLVRELVTLLAGAGFELGKWSSNEPTILADLPQAQIEASRDFLENVVSPTKILGVKFNPLDDCFTYVVSPFTGVITRRSVLSYIAKTFDPQGWISPCVMRLKLYLQNLWTLGLGWDAEVPSHLQQEWNHIVSSLPILSNVCLPRLIGPPDAPRRIIGFCDASTLGYAASLYLHSDNDDGVTACVRLVASKTRLAPLKTQTVCRLELNGALLLAQLYQLMLPSIGNVLPETRLFTDARVVLDWLHTPLHKLKIYIANRIDQILDCTELGFWSHVSSESNAADLPSRGCSAEDLVNCVIWWEGPAFIRQHSSKLPPAGYCRKRNEVPEMKPSPPVVLVATAERDDQLLDCLNRFSSLRTVYRVTAYVLRFIRSCLKRPGNNPIVLSTSLTALASNTADVLIPDEIAAAKRLCVYLVQRRYFSAELSVLKSGKTPKNWKSLTPFLDADRLIRVGGRLTNASVPMDVKHPYLLPKSSHFSNLVVDYFHLKSLHAGPRTTQALICQQYWIISARSLVRKRVHHCITCLRFRQPTVQPIMGALPAERITPQRPFLSTGLDFGGPFSVRSSSLRSAKLGKGYLCLFVCLVTKAIHLEFVSDLSTSAFMAALDRFVSRRGSPNEIFSDNGRNFRGAANCLREVYDYLEKNRSDLSTVLTDRNIHWNFQPPYSPHFGGIYESGIKQAKRLMRHTVGDQSLTFEEFSTLFCRIEAILNSRPLCAPSQDPNEEATTLTPGHFLVGASLMSIPERPMDLTVSPYLRWKRVKHMTQSFWNRWSREYLHTLLPRKKWTESHGEVKLGDLVLMKNTATLPTHWPIAKIIATHPGPDGIVRVVTVLCQGNNYRRAVNRLVPLPVA